MYKLADYNYTLPSELIAQTPADPPQSCKFLVYDKQAGTIQDKIFSDLVGLIDPDTMIVFNNSKVLKARLLLQGGGEIFYLSGTDTHTFSALVRPGKKFKVGDTIHYTDEITFHVDGLTEDGRQLTASKPILEILEHYGQMPLPPYIKYNTSLEEPYQPVFAHTAGSVAAPTASLHFTTELIDQLTSRGVEMVYTTLHVGLGTFKPVHTDNIKSHDIHAETIEIDKDVFTRLADAKLNNRKILAVGTTVTRTLESLPYLWKLLQELSPSKLDNITTRYRNDLTKNITIQDAKRRVKDIKLMDATLQFASTLFLYPGQSFYMIDQLITNFHLPKSSLLMLVAGVVGYDQMKEIYDHAISERYRFYSFGDAMWIQ